MFIYYSACCLCIHEVHINCWGNQDSLIFFWWRLREPDCVVNFCNPPLNELFNKEKTQINANYNLYNGLMNHNRPGRAEVNVKGQIFTKVWTERESNNWSDERFSISDINASHDRNTSRTNSKISPSLHNTRAEAFGATKITLSF